MESGRTNWKNILSPGGLGCEETDPYDGLRRPAVGDTNVTVLATGNPISATASAPAIRPLRRADIGQIAQLHNSLLLGDDRPPHEQLCDYMDRLFFSDPWVSDKPALSRVCVDDDGQVLGFFGGHPRRFSFEGRTVSAVAVGQLMVHPSARRQGIAQRLATALTDGSHTVTLTTSANQASAAVLRKLGFWHPPFGGLKWRKSLHSDETRVSRLRGRLKRLLGRSGVADSEDHSRRIACRPITDSAEWHRLRLAAREFFPLSSHYDADHTQWLWDMMHDSPARVRPWAVAVVDDENGAIGWAIGQVSPEGAVTLLELACRPTLWAAALGSLFRHAAGEGLTMIAGPCTDPALTAAAVRHGASLKDMFCGWAAHSKDPQIGLAMTSGQVFWSELDGEAWPTFRAFPKTASA